MTGAANSRDDVGSAATILFAVTAAALAVGCSSTSLDVPRPPSYAIDRPEETFLGRTFAMQLAAAPGQSGFHLLV